MADVKISAIARSIYCNEYYIILYYIISNNIVSYYIYISCNLLETIEISQAGSQPLGTAHQSSALQVDSGSAGLGESAGAEQKGLEIIRYLVISIYIYIITN